MQKNRYFPNPQNKDYIAVYLPAWGDAELIKLFKTIKMWLGTFFLNILLKVIM